MNEVESPETVELRQGEPDLGKLINACADGHIFALEQLFKVTSPSMFAILRRILRTSSLAEAALQDTYVKIWKNAKQFDATRNAPDIWLNSIARNHAIGIVRHRRTREDVELNLDNTLVESLPPFIPEHNYKLRAGQQLDQGLHKLTAPARECLVLAYCEGYSVEELSERLDRPVGTIRNWIRRSLTSLKEGLDEHI